MRMTVSELNQIFARTTAELRIPELLKEIDHQLTLLYKAMQLNDKNQMEEIKENLKALSIEKLRLEA